MHAECDIVLPIPSVRPSVCLSIAGTRSKGMDTLSPHFVTSGRNIVLVFFSPTALQIPLETLLAGELNARGGGFAIDQNRRLSRKRYEIGPRLLWINRQWPIDPCRFH